MGEKRSIIIISIYQEIITQFLRWLNEWMKTFIWNQVKDI